MAVIITKCLWILVWRFNHNGQKPRDNYIIYEQSNNARHVVKVSYLVLC